MHTSVNVPIRDIHSEFSEFTTVSGKNAWTRIDVNLKVGVENVSSTSIRF